MTKLLPVQCDDGETYYVSLRTQTAARGQNLSRKHRLASQLRLTRVSIY
jgi:hypothetical protein